MKVKGRVEDQLILEEMRQRIAELETADAERRRAEEALRQAEQEKTAILSNMSELVAHQDAEMRILWANRAVSEATGVPLDQLLGRFCYEVRYRRSEPCVGCPVVRACETGRPEEGEIVTPDGRVWLIRGYPILDASGNIISVVKVGEDFTERKRAEEALRESQGNYRVLFESTLDGLFVIDAVTMRVVLANEVAAKMYGFDSVQQAVGVNPLDFVPPDDRERVLRLIVEDMFEKDLHQVNEFRTMAKDGREIWIGAVGSRTEFGGRLAGLISIRDITERRRAEEALRQAEQEKTAILSSMSELVAHQDAEMRVLWANRAVSEATGVPLDQLLGRFCYEVRYRRSEPCVGCPVVRACETGRPEEGEIVTPDGRVWLIRGYPILDASGNIISVVKVGEDFTERKRAEEELRESEEKYRRLIEALQEGIWVIDQDAYTTFVNERMAEMLGYSVDEMLGRHLFSFMDERGVAIAKRDLERRQQGVKEQHEFEFLRKDGMPVYMLLETAPITDDSGTYAGAIAGVVDITERKRMEEALRESEQELQAIFDGVTDGIVLLDPTGRVVKVNKRLEYIGGYGPEEIVGKSFDSLRMFAPESMAKMVSGFVKSISGERVPAYEVEAYSKKGEKRVVEIRGSRLRKSGQVVGVVVIVRDITERKLWEEQLNRTLRELQRTLSGTVGALAQMAEARDPYTAGHQRGVAQLATAIAEEMGLQEEQLEGIRVAGMLHDIGKIHVPAEILSKPGRLSDIEFSLIKVHVQLGHDILKAIEFRWPVAQMVLQHHERMDGSGYPSGLSGEEILLEARILAVADVVNAMTHHRPYRPARGIDKALEEISKNSGVLYDVDVVEACLKLLGGQGRQLYEAGDLTMHLPIGEGTLDIRR